MAGSNKMRALNRLPYDFEDGLKIGGVDVTTLNQMSTANGAGLVGFTPVGNLGSTTVQAAIAELDVEKVDNAALAASAGSSLVGYDGSTVQTVLDSAKPISDYTALRAYTGRATSVRITSNGIAGFFYRDDADTTSVDNGGTIIVASNEKRWKRAFEGAINVKWFGAKGNGVDDDSAAFIAANNWLMSRTDLGTRQAFEYVYAALDIPPGVYKIKGNRIFGSQIPTGASGTYPVKMLTVNGQGASLIWEVQNEDDELFYFDGTIGNPNVSGLSIYVARSVDVPGGAGVVFRFYSNTALTTQSNASKLHLTDISVWPGRLTESGVGQRPKYIFYNTGNAMCDQMLIENCRFNYMQKVWVGRNSQAVNITFNSCSFYAASAGVLPDVVYFDFESMDDNFNVENCSFSITKGETLLRALSPELNGTYKSYSGYNFNFKNNRIESIASAAGAWTLCNINFGTFNFSGSNLGIGSGSGLSPTFVRAFGLGNLNLNGIIFNTVYFYFPVSNIFSAGKILPSFGAMLENCTFSPNAVFFKYYDGTAEYSLQSIFTSALLWRSVKIKDCVLAKSSDFLNWSYVNPRLQYSESSIAGREIQKITFSKTGIALMTPFKLPPFQAIKKIMLNMSGVLPDTYNAFRVWIGDRSLNNFFDVDNVRPDIRKNDYVLFEGTAIIFNSNENYQTIEISLLNAGIESGGVLSEITIEYAGIDFSTVGITTSADQIKLLKKSESVYIGTTSQRPDVNIAATTRFFDTTLNKPIWWTGAAWVDATGAIV